MTLDEMERITAIHLRLYELQGHTCNGDLEITPDGPTPGSHGCTGCSEYIRLSNELRRLKKERA